ncbi:extracellular serine-threonine rich protein [Histoplasma ohiense]|nr:extracellular serine-threonine rich protein [Histoplasma ohiense (nom. inval.)]
MKTTLSVVAILATAVQQTSATFSWDTNKYFPNPSNCDNKCTDNQKSGFDWKGLGLGSFSSFGDFDFSGFTCGNRKPSKSNFQSKCVEGKVLKGITNGSPEISYRKSDGFSITSFQITVDKDTDIAFVYSMPDGSSCKHTTPCSQGGSEVQNTQCGGAVSVRFGLPKYSELDDCGFAIHKINFDCGPPDIPSKPVVVPTDENLSYPISSPPDRESEGQSYPVSLTPTAQLPESSIAPTSTESYPVEIPPGTPSETSPGATSGLPSGSYPAGTPSGTLSQTYPSGATPGFPSEIYPSGSSSGIPSETSPGATPGLPPGSYPAGTPPGTPSETSPGATPGLPSEIYPSGSSGIPSETAPGATPGTLSQTYPPGATPSENTPPGSTPPETTPVGTAPPVVTLPDVTPGGTPYPTEAISYSTSTVFTTSIITITHCGPEVPSCPADSTEVVTSTIAISTTICPVTITPTSPDSIVTGPIPTSPTPAYPTPTSPAGSTTPPIPTVPNPDTLTYPVGESTATLPGSSALPVTQPHPSDLTVTEITYTTVTTCPVTGTITSGTTEITYTTNTVSTITVTTTGTVCPGCSVPPPSDSSGISYPTGLPTPPNTYPAPSESAAPSSPSAFPVTNPPGPSTPALPPAIPIEAPCPKVLPQCLNTWLNLVPKCNSNSDISCFCPSSKFTSAVIACIQSWGASDDEIQSSLSYFAGICAADVPKNPGIITAIPSTITLTPPPAATPPAARTGGNTLITPPPQAPRTEITVSQVISYSAAEPTTRTTIVTVPQVQFVTETIPGAATGKYVGLVQGTALPEEVPTYAPLAYPAAAQPSTFATISVSPTGNPTPNPYIGTGDALSRSIPSAVWIISSITIFMGILQ